MVASEQAASPAVHPRVGGEQVNSRSTPSVMCGSSPRGRGTGSRCAIIVTLGRFIPAWAGNRYSGARQSGARPVHPRVGGEQPWTSAASAFATGSSPRGRGTGRSYRASGGAGPVHPRVGGEQGAMTRAMLSGIGSSPRGRGTAIMALSRICRPRFIPAWAGNSRRRHRQTGRRPVHPRVGGEQRGATRLSGRRCGSSPRGRGTDPLARSVARPDRFIPAWAGNSHCQAWERKSSAVHPRVGGEQSISRRSFVNWSGSSPRGRGTDPNDWPEVAERRFIPAWAGNSSVPVSIISDEPVHPRVGGEQRFTLHASTVPDGSSPRGRGTVPHEHISLPRLRFIPAWAGNSPRRHVSHSVHSVHPRVGGEQVASASAINRPIGSSPRGRGTGLLDRNNGLQSRFIPAWAGNSPDPLQIRQICPVHPRVGGEQPPCAALTMAAGGSSPRGRGTAVDVIDPSRFVRFIPAWAGNRCEVADIPIADAVHPRVGGEQTGGRDIRPNDRGSSPRGRGTGSAARSAIPAARFIPAWAGNSGRPPICETSAPVHPRVGGEQCFLSRAPKSRIGSSPRGRGTGSLRRCIWRHERFIPAWAGNSHSDIFPRSASSVHPRVGGEQAGGIGVFVSGGGSSPRGRGTVGGAADLGAVRRFIPAWAGNSERVQVRSWPKPVHPRVGGEQGFARG